MSAAKTRSGLTHLRVAGKEPRKPLEEHPFFKGLDAEAARTFVQAATERVYATGEVVFEEGSEPDAFFLVLSGKVIFFKNVPGAKPQTISQAGEGDFIGEIGVLTGAPRALQAVAATTTHLARLPREVLRDFMRNTPGPIDQIIQSIVNHLHHTTHHYVADMVRQEKMALVGTMVNSIIHDFKNPFTLISLATQVMMMNHPDPATQLACNRIMAQIQRMVDMAAEVAEFSKGRTVLKPKQVDMGELIERFRELNDPYFHKDKLRIEIKVEPIVIEGEENKLLRLIQNLVVNAIEASEENSKAVVRVQILDKGEHCEITVADNGGGIPEKIRETLFDAFVTYGKSRGTGLGTAIVKSIVDAHNGSIRFETETGKGTTFFISLPKSQGMGT